MSKQITIEYTETVTRRITLRATSERKAKQMIEAGPLSYLKAVVDEQVVSSVRSGIKVVKDEEAM